MVKTVMTMSWDHRQAAWLSWHPFLCAGVQLASDHLSHDRSHSAIGSSPKLWRLYVQFCLCILTCGTAALIFYITEPLVIPHGNQFWLFFFCCVFCERSRPQCSR